MAYDPVATGEIEDGGVTRQHWKWTCIASMADYIDAGSIVALGAGLAIWGDQYGMGPFALGLVAALGPNAISNGVGALVGGRLGDALGRKRIYQYDLLLYAFGTLWFIFAVDTWMLFVGAILVGLAVGADLPASWALIAELSPSKARGKLMGLTNFFWAIGPMVTLGLALALAPLGLFGIRIVFAQLLVAAVVTWHLRRGMVESIRWRNARANMVATCDDRVPSPLAMANLRELLTRPNIRALLFLCSMYMLWNIAAGTVGIFFPFFLRTLGSQTQAASVGLSSFGFLLTALATVLIFMPFSDRVSRRVMFALGAGLQVLAWILFAFLPISFLWVILMNIVMFSVGGALAQYPYFRVWSQELLPTGVRNTGQGIAIAFSRVSLGVWSLFVPTLAAVNIVTIAWVLSGILLVSGLVGVVGAPNTRGKTLEQIQDDRAGTVAAY